MTEMALVKDGLVVNVIVVGPTYEPPVGHVLVPLVETVGIGHAYDGHKFDAPKPNKDALTTHVQKRYRDIRFFPIKVPGAVVVAELDQSTLIHRLALMAVANSNFTTSFAQPKKLGSTADSTVITLDATQIMALDAGLTAYLLAMHETYTQLLMGIESSSVTTHAQVDNPPKPIQAWPARHHEAL